MAFRVRVRSWYGVRSGSVPARGLCHPGSTRLARSGRLFVLMFIAMIAASAAGAMIPVVLVKLNRDPATASSIILTTVTDVLGFFTFLGLATLLSGMLAGS